MTKRLENLTENTLVEKIKYLEEQLKDMKTLQTVGSESWLQISSQWQWNWTSNTSYTSLVPSRGVIDFDTWMNYSMYFECLCSLMVALAIYAYITKLIAQSLLEVN